MKGLPQWLREKMARIGGKLIDKVVGYLDPLRRRTGEIVARQQETQLFLGIKSLIRKGWRAVLPLLRYFKLNFKFTSLTRRILVYNMFGLVILVGGVLVLNQYRAGLIDLRVQNLLTQGKIIAEAIAASSSIDTDNVMIDPEELLEMQSDHDAVGSIESFNSLEFPINPERAAPILLRLIAPTGTRARIYDHEGVKLLDSKTLNDRGRITQQVLPPLGKQKISKLTRFARWVKRVWRGNVPIYVDIGSANGKGYSEVRSALGGHAMDMSRLSEHSELVVSVAVPIQRMRAVLGVLMLSTRGDDIDKIVKDEFVGIMRVALIALAVMLALSLWLANQIGAPMRKLAAGARKIRHSATAREEIPDFTWRTDEIGELSLALRNMTQALYSRIEAIETFAADVAHELKNPLTSLKSAVETLPLVQKEELRERLTGIILHDVQRLDRLISDISNASRLDAELAREESKSIDLAQLLQKLIPAFNDIHRDNGVEVTIKVNKVAGCPRAFLVNGHDRRIGQVINNLVDNALSFSPDNSKVSVSISRMNSEIDIRIEDEGPGIPPDNLEKIFKRFYTDRPEEQGFGNNSGLGLNISEQIILSHKGRIWAENRLKKNKIIGARFIIRLKGIVEC